MKNVPAMSKKQEPYFLRSKSSARKKRSPGRPSFLKSDDYKKLPARQNLAGNNIFNCRKRDSQALRRRAIRATSPSRLRDAVAGSGPLAVSPEIARALNVGVWAEPGVFTVRIISPSSLAITSLMVYPVGVRA